MSSETDDLDQEYLDEDPSILTDDELLEIATKYGRSLEKTKTLAKEMSKARGEVKKQQE